MDEVVSIMGDLLSSETDARVALITIAVFVIFVIVAIALIGIVYKLYKTIHTESKKEYEKEAVEKEYHKKVDETAIEVQSIAKLLNHMGDQINKSNENTAKELKSIREMIDTQSTAGCPFGQNSTKSIREEVEDLKTENMETLQSEISLLLESDRERIKSYITEQYHKWMALGYIDLYVKKSIDEQYIRYRREHGNTFVTSMVQELHNLPTKMITTNCVTPRMVEEVKQERILPSEYFKDDDADGIPDFIYDDNVVTMSDKTPDGKPDEM